MKDSHKQDSVLRPTHTANYPILGTPDESEVLLSRDTPSRSIYGGVQRSESVEIATDLRPREDMLTWQSQGGQNWLLYSRSESRWSKLWLLNSQSESGGQNCCYSTVGQSQDCQNCGCSTVGQSQGGQKLWLLHSRSESGRSKLWLLNSWSESRR